MIKLIVTDLDGSLLHDDKSHSPKLEALIDELNKRGVVFAFASGRALFTMRDVFGDLLYKTATICGNGCILMMNGEVVHMNVLSPVEIDLLLDASSKTGVMEVLLNTDKNHYYTTSEPRFKMLIDKYSRFSVKVDAFDEARRSEKVVNISFYDPVDPITHGIKALESISDRFLLIPSGDEWLDTVKLGEDKGACLKRLQGILNVTPQETMCFGDYHNDAGLMEHCEYSYAMKNAHPDLKRLCKYETRLTNNEDGVLDTICSMLDIEL